MADFQMTARHTSFRARVLAGLIAAAAIGISVASPAAAAPGGGCTSPYGTYQNCNHDH